MFIISYRNYSNNDIQNILNQYDLFLIEYITSKNIIAHDKDGYKYKITLTNLLGNKTPSKWMRNPFVVENLRLYLSINCPNYIWLDNEYKGIKAKYRFICLNHIEEGIQYNTFDNIINNHHICKYCSYEKMRDDRVLPLDEVIQLCKNKNVEYYGRYTKNHETYIQYYCKSHPDIIQEMSLTHFRTSNVPCHFCNITSGELKIHEYLLRRHINHIPQYSFDDCVSINKLRFDFYLPEFNTCIEYDGQQHYFPVNFNGSNDNGISDFENTQKRDQIKNDYCQKNNIKLIRIPYWEYNDIENILSAKL